MSETAVPPAPLPDDGPLNPMQVEFVQTFVVKRRLIRQRRGDVPRRAKADPRKAIFDKLAAGNASLFSAADAAVQAAAGSKSIATELATYATASQGVPGVAQDGADYDALIAEVKQRRDAARALLKAAASRQARLQKYQQSKDQVAAHAELAPTLDDVKRTTLPAGSVQIMLKTTPKADEAAFRPFLAAMMALEQSRAGLAAGKPASAQEAAGVKAAADGVIREAQGYIAHVEGLGLPTPLPADHAAKVQRCTVAMQQARHLALAAAFDQIPVPSREQPWDQGTQFQVSALRATIAFEQSGQPATGLGVDAGASTSYWIRDKDPDAIAADLDAGAPQGKGERLFIFKPAKGEERVEGGKEVKGSGAVKEALAAGNARLFAQQTGIDLGVPETTVVTLSQVALADGDPAGPALVGSAQRNVGVAEELEGMPASTKALLPKEDVHKVAILDIMQLTVDRHEGNLMVRDGDPAKGEAPGPRLVPIDHGGTMPSRRDFPQVKQRLGGLRLDAADNAQVINALLTIPSAYEPFEPMMLAQLSRLDPDRMEAAMLAQRDAIGQANPGLDPQDKVGNDALHMSKRSMMFLKLAARKLSPAEVQIALGVHGEALFDVDDQGFDALAQQVIDEQVTKKAGYLEVMFLQPEEQARICDWLGKNGWNYSSGGGTSTGMDMLIQDPVAALKLYKAQRANPNAPSVPAHRPTRYTDATAEPDPVAKGEILRLFPKTKDKWPQQLAALTAFNQWGGEVAYRQALAAVNATAQANMSAAAELMEIWAELNQPGNAAGLAVLPALKDGKNIQSARDVLLQALRQAKQDAAAAVVKQAGQAAAANIDDAAAQAGSVVLIARLLRAMLAAVADQGMAAGHLAQLAVQEAAAANGQEAAAEAAVRQLEIAVTKDVLQDMQATAAALHAQLLRLLQGRVAPADANPEAYKAEAAAALETVAATKKWLNAQLELDKLRQWIGLVQAWPKAPGATDQDDDQPPPVAPQVMPPVGQPVAPTMPQADAPQEEEDFPEAEEEAAEEDGDEAADTAGTPLASFEWQESSGKAAIKFAVKNGLFKKQKTGLGENIRKVKAARKVVDATRAGTGTAKQRERLLALEAAYSSFSIFNASRLRGVSQDPRWQGYCNLLADEVQKYMTSVRTQIAALNG